MRSRSPSPELGWITAQTLTVDGGRMDYIWTVRNKPVNKWRVSAALKPHLQRQRELP